MAEESNTNYFTTFFSSNVYIYIYMCLCVYIYIYIYSVCVCVYIYEGHLVSPKAHPERRAITEHICGDNILPIHIN